MELFQLDEDKLADGNLQTHQRILQLFYAVLVSHARHTGSDVTLYDILLDGLLDHPQQNLPHNPYLELSLPVPLFIQPDWLCQLYSLIKDKDNGKKNGSFYTPKPIAKYLADQLFETYSNQFQTYPPMVIDPSCGGGELLAAACEKYLELGQDLDDILKNRLIGFDIDPVAIFLCRFQLLYISQAQPNAKPDLKNKNISREQDPFNIRQINFLELSPNSLPKQPGLCFISNPPWTTRLDQGTRNSLNKSYELAEGEFCLSSIFLEKMHSLFQKRTLVAVLMPESISKIGNHANTRKFIANQLSLHRCESLGDPFPGVYAPCMSMVLGANHTLEIRSGESVIPKKDFFKGPNYIFNLNFNASSEAFCEKIENNCMQVGQLEIDFFLGIVTGDNAQYIKKERLNESYEPILGGKNIFPYRATAAQNYILFDKNNFQQSVPKDRFLQPKLIYRFISQKLVFAYDNQGHLLLNNANAIRINQDQVNPFYLLALLNSDLLNSYYQYRYRALRVLKGNLSQLPLRFGTRKQQLELIKLSEQQVKSPSLNSGHKHKIDDLVRIIYTA